MVGKTPSILVVDDEQVVCDVLCDYLDTQGYKCTAVLSGSEAQDKLAEQNFDVVLLDIRLPGMSGMDVLHEIWSQHSSTKVIMITAVNNVSTAVEAMKLGASDYIVKPFDLEKINASISTALSSKKIAKKPAPKMDSIALGVEMGLDPFSEHSKIVIQKTIEIAQMLGIAESEIQRWKAAKERLDSKKKRLFGISAVESSNPR